MTRIDPTNRVCSSCRVESARVTVAFSRMSVRMSHVAVVRLCVSFRFESHCRCSATVRIALILGQVGSTRYGGAHGRSILATMVGEARIEKDSEVIHASRPSTDAVSLLISVILQFFRKHLQMESTS
ncbi:hypothetical protein MA16_Dca025526 [Dendrobium catenatum]|uniref:Uncharacterized protein n=1 Tax=Dendrobium catenatum TaxID=906689 RepID=A0A2I0VX70_9ASPA|nr:hypothetical protein MA16_Dca025526 [Dendrobium catenatum]